MATSVKTMTSLPPWKQSLVEKRELQLARAGKTGNDGLIYYSQTPPWKYEISYRKRNQVRNDGTGKTANSNDRLAVQVEFDNSQTEPRNKPMTSVESRDIGTSCDDSAIDEHLLPVRLNPIWRLDIEKRRSVHTEPNDKTVLTTKKIHSQLPIEGEHNFGDECCRTNYSMHSRVDNKYLLNKPINNMHPSTELRNNYFLTENETELEYGQGFVSRLLNRFRQLSMKQENLLSCRSVSTDNLIDNGHISADPRNHLSSRSMENLSELAIFKDSAISDSDIRDNNSKVMPIKSLGESEVIGKVDIQSGTSLTVEDELPKPNTVVNVRTVFENISKLGGSYAHKTKANVSDQRRLPEKAKTHVNGIHSTVLEPPRCSHDGGGSNKHVVLHNRTWNKKLNYCSNCQTELYDIQVPATDCENNPMLTFGDTTTRNEAYNRGRLNLNLSNTPPTSKASKVADAIRSPVWSKNSADGGLREDTNNARPVVFVRSGLTSVVESNNNETTNSQTDYDVTEVNDDENEIPREGDPSEFAGTRSSLYDFEGAGIIVDRSLLVKSKDTKQMTISFNESAPVTHEYPSERCLVDVDDDDAAQAVDSTYYDSSLSSYKLRSYLGKVPHDSKSQPDSIVQPILIASDDSNAIVSLKPVDSDSSNWSSSATSDLLF